MGSHRKPYMTLSSDGVYETEPVYQIEFPQGGLHTVCAGYTGRGTSPENNYFSFHRPTTQRDCTQQLAANLQSLAYQLKFDIGKLTWPNGSWPHTGRVIKAEDCKWVADSRTGGIVPVSKIGSSPIAYDSVVTKSCEYVLGAQGADCSSIFFHDSKAGVIGLAHAGWKPLVRGVVANTVSAMEELGARPEDISAFISPGAGDRFFQFHWDERMESHIGDIFVQAGREDLLTSSEMRYEISEEDCRELGSALGKEIERGTTFRLGILAVKELMRCGISPAKILSNVSSTLVDRYASPDGKLREEFRYHSYRRDQPNHGLGMSVLYMAPKPL